MKCSSFKPAFGQLKRFNIASGIYKICTMPFLWVSVAQVLLLASCLVQVDLFIKEVKCFI